MAKTTTPVADQYVSENIWLVVYPVVELVRADSAEDAEAIIHNALEDVGFTPYSEGDGIVVDESEPVPEASLFTPHRCPGR